MAYPDNGIDARLDQSSIDYWTARFWGDKVTDQEREVRADLALSVLEEWERIAEAHRDERVTPAGMLANFACHRMVDVFVELLAVRKPDHGTSHRFALRAMVELRKTPAVERRARLRTALDRLVTVPNRPASLRFDSLGARELHIGEAVRVRDGNPVIAALVG